jgi:hypothetical protein
MDDAFLASMQYGGPSRGRQQRRTPEEREQYAAFKNQTMDRVVSILTPEQREKWDVMTGPPFKGSTSERPRGDRQSPSG